MREREVYMFYEMNKKSNIVIETPVGMTDSITVHEIVKQGPYLVQNCVMWHQKRLMA